MAHASSHAKRALAAATEELRWEDDERERDADSEEDEDARAEAEAEAAALAEIRGERGADGEEGNDGEKEFVYDVEGLHDKLEEFGWTGSEAFIESMVVDAADAAPADVDAHDDLKRELVFYQQGLAAVREGIQRFHKLGLPFQRPNDFYAQMVKDDLHMKKVKDKLLHEKKAVEESEERRKQRLAKKYQKHVAAERQKERTKSKKAEVENIKRWRKNRERNGFADGKASQEELEAMLAQGPKRKLNDRGNARIRPGDNRSKQRLARDEKFGFGGRKGLKKHNDRDSYMDASAGFSGHKKSFGGGKGGGAGGARGGVNKRGPAKRPGKNRRQQSRSKHQG